MINFLQVLLFAQMMPKLYMKFVPCDDTLTDLGWIVFESEANIKCDDDPQADYRGSYDFTTYAIWVRDGNPRYQVASHVDLNTTTCGIMCNGCYGGIANQCINCAAKSRGKTKPYPVMDDIINKRPLDCGCGPGMKEKVPQLNYCECLASNYYQVAIKNPLSEACYECPINYALCDWVYLSDPVQITPRQCAAGLGRELLGNSPTCGCKSNYLEFNPMQKDCKPKCGAPCATCVGESNTQCATCQDVVMTINENQKCVCPSNYYMDATKNNVGDIISNFCVLCHYSCTTCAVSSTTCVTCSAANNRMIASGTCPCNQYYFGIYNQPECLPCHWTCATCSSVNSCDSCVSNSNRDVLYAQYQDYFCNCKIGYAEDINSNQCLPCQDTCLTCVKTTDTCSSCDATKYRELVNYRCQCFARYFEVQGEVICQECAPTCLSCDGDSEANCLSCLLTSFRILNNQKECQCKQGYGYDYQFSEQCIQCQGICQKCDYYDNCIQCPDGLNRILDSNNICSCDNGFYQDTNSLCKACHYSCETCDQGSQYNCLTCNTDIGRIFNDNDKSCECSPGYFEFYKKCVACYYTCLACVNQYKDGCTSCPSSRILSDETQQHSQCLCKSVSQIDDGKSLECTNCHYSCLTCGGPEMSNCLTCYDNSSNSLTISRFLKYGQCSCPNDWYDDQINENCLKCHISCDTCFYSDEYSCITCSEINYRVQLSNSCYCQDGYFENLSTLICEQCEYRCGTCKLDKTNCLSCLEGSLRTLVDQTNNINYKTCQCPASAPNDVEGTPICQTCHFTCQNCTDKGLNQCTLCDSTANRVISTDADGSYCKCALSYYEIQTPECAQCSSYCLGCVDTAANCISCNPQQFRELDGNKCKCASRFGTLQLSYYDNMQDPECIACHYSCYTCNGPQYNQCLTCSDSDFRTQQGSECICKPKYIDNGEGVCMTCNESCETCAGQKNLCTSCPAGSLRTLNVQSQSCDCPLGYFDSGAQICEQCDVKCASCTNQSTTCLSCVTGSNRTLNQFSDTCECLSGYYDLGTGVCAICHYTCLQCSGPTSSECISCPDYLATKRSFIGSSCLCPDQYFDDQNNQLCQPCSSTCHTCQINQNSCTVCVIGQNRALQGQQCICQSSYYESGSPACSKCFDQCQECQITSTTCTQCDSSLNRALDQSKCNCIPGYYDDGTLICKQCHYSCQTCATTDQHCTSCDSLNFRQLISNQCDCINGTTDQGIAMCYSCDTRCLTCTNITTQCLSCDSTQLRILSGYNCNCKDGYYENNIKQCIVCDPNCLTCVNTSTNCTSCNLTQNKIMDSTYKCICKNGYYADSNDVCQQCSNKCQTCSQTASKCTSCFTDRTLQINICNCLSGFYDSATGCQRCSYQCDTCQNTATQCSACDPISNRTLQSQQCICNSGYFDIGAFVCVQCAQTCLTCQSSNTNCKSCDSSLNRILNGSSCDCMPGYYSLNQDKQCSQCNISCPTCVDSSTKCTSCDITTTFRMDQSIAFNKCPCIPGFYDDGTTICKKCSYKCINCVGSSDNCTICHINSGYFRNNLQPTCDCQAGYFDDGVQVICQKCGPKCQTCQTSNTNCLVCESSSTRLTAPQCDCKPGYFEDSQKKCQNCSANCMTCSIKQNNCLTCQPDRISKDCLCQDGYYEANLPLCQACSYKCSTCAQDPLNCLTCAPDRLNAPNCLCKYHYYDDLVNTLCQECDQYCGKCDLNGCIDCSGNRIQSGKTCICPIDSISYTYTPYCSNCEVAVIKGMFSDDISKLIYTFEYDLQFNFPIQVDQQAYCSYLILDQSLKLLGEAPQCEIQEKQLIISLGSGSSVVVGDVIQFNSTILKHTHCTTPLQLIIKTELQAPLQLLKPSIKLNYPLVPVSPCASIDVRIEQQFVNGQRNLQLGWSSSLSIPSIDQANQLQFQTLTIEQGQVPQNSEIDISITFTNFLGQSDKITIKFQTLSASVPQFSFKTIKKSYVSWVPIKILVYYANTICTGGVQTTLNNPVQVKFEEIIQARQPSSSNAITFQQQIFTQQDSEGMISTIIPSRTLSVNSNYSILSTFVDLTTNQVATAQLDITIERSPLMVEIIGGSRIQNYLKSFKIEIQSKDPDIQTEWNQDSDIHLLVECIDLQHDNKPCADQINKTVPLNKTSNIQYIAPRLFQPFTVLLFRVNCSKQNFDTVSASAAIIMLDAELPTINVSYPAGYNIRDVNINEKLKFQIMLDQNQKISDLDFSFALVYNYEIVHVKTIPNQNLTFAIWEGFQKFNFINQISIRFQAHDINYLMPSVGTVTLSVNMPPVSSIISIAPQEGQALSTQYNFRVTNAKDIDSPIQYRFAYYQSLSLYQDDIQSGDYDNLIILQDFSTVQTYKSILESGNLTILISVSDSLGSTVNYTYSIKSQSFYEQWQLSQEENTTSINSSYCKQMVQELQFQITDHQQLMITALEYLKLLRQQIQKDCIKPINLQLKKIQNLLFDMMLKQANPIIQSRISNVLAQVYQLNLDKEARLLQQNDQICFNTSNNQIQFKQLTYISPNVTDNNEMIQNISLINSQIQRAIAINSNLTLDYSQIQDIGDDYTARTLIQNQELRKSFLRILGGLYNSAYEQKIAISTLVDQLMNSFQQNLILDNSVIKIQTNGFGLQLSKIGQKTYQNFLIREPYNPDYMDLSNFTINRYIQLVKYKTNKYLYTNEFKQSFQNNSKILNKKETNKYIYEKSIIPYSESYMFDPQIYVDNKEHINLVKYIHQGKLAFNMGTQLKTCNDSSTYDSINSYNFVCSSFIKEKWDYESCQLEQYMDKNGFINFKCLCKYMDPLALMIMNVSNLTKTQTNETKQKQINPEEFISINTFENMTLFMIIFCVISISVVAIFIRIRKQQINMNDQKQRFKNEKQIEVVVEITKIPRMSVPLFKINLKYLHEISRLIFVNYIYLSFAARILLSVISINILITSIHVFNVVIKNTILSVVISLLISMIFQVIVKVLEGFLNGPSVLKIIGYTITVLLNLGIFSLNIVINSAQYNPIIQLIQTIIGLIILYGPLEIIIQYVRLTAAFIIYNQLKLDPMNPVINLIYYFLQDEIVICIVQGEVIY